MARFRLYEKVYTTSALDEITLKDLVVFNTQAEQVGISRKWSDVERVAAELSVLSPEEADKHPEKYLAIAVTIWASRRTSGEDVTFDEAIDFPMKAIEFLPEPGDRQPGKRKGGQEGPGEEVHPNFRPGRRRPSERRTSVGDVDDVKEAVYDRIIELDLLGSSINVLNVWDLPLWAWRSYAALVDDQRAKAREEARRGR